VNWVGVPRRGQTRLPARIPRFPSLVGSRRQDASRPRRLSHSRQGYERGRRSSRLALRSSRGNCAEGLLTRCNRLSVLRLMAGSMPHCRRIATRPGLWRRR
jgi:hypothetical protein